MPSSANCASSSAILNINRSDDKLYLSETNGFPVNKG